MEPVEPLDDASEPAGFAEGKSLCLNMIVKNEMANLPRCLSAVADHIACWVIGDTGSTDGTQEFIQNFFARRGIPGELHSFSFENFEQARNQALAHAYDSNLEFDYLLFADADMELIVEDHDFRSKLTAPGYMLLQRAVFSYWNTRLVRRDVRAAYYGITHEYIDVPGGTERLQGVWYQDHASGSNRVDKFERDIRLLLEGLRSEPENHRYWFYLAQSYRDAGRLPEAADAYGIRAAKGGWPEEAWYARLQEARIRLGLGDETAFVRLALAAFNERPHRAEPLYDLTKFYRERGLNDVALLYCERGLAIPRPGSSESLFIEDYIYEIGFKEEYSISANYSQDSCRWDTGRRFCEYLALVRHNFSKSQELAKYNLIFYIVNADKIFPSLTFIKIEFPILTEYQPMSPSIAVVNDKIQMVLCYVKDDDDDDEFAQFTKNYLLTLDGDYSVSASAEITWVAGDHPADNIVQSPKINNALVFNHQGTLCGLSIMRDREGGQEVSIWKLSSNDKDNPVAEWRLVAAIESLKNLPCIPQTDGNNLQLLQGSDPLRIYDEEGTEISVIVPPISINTFYGESPLIPFKGGWLGISREVATIGSDIRHAHRFLWYDQRNRLSRISPCFSVCGQWVEYVSGLASGPDGRNVVISYTVGNHDVWLAVVRSDDIGSFLVDISEIVSRSDLPAVPNSSERQVSPRSGARRSSLPTKSAIAPKIDSDNQLAPGISLIIRARNEAKVLRQNLESLRALNIPHEIIVILHSCTDRSREIVSSFDDVKIFEFNQELSRAGYENLITPANSSHSFVYYSNWCFSKAKHLWCFKWDADFVATSALINFLNAQCWDDRTPTRIRIPVITENSRPHVEPYLFNAGREYGKYIFWEYNRSIFLPGVKEISIDEPITHASPLRDELIKPYWKNPPWFEHADTEEAVDLRTKYKSLVSLLGPEPLGLARAGNPICDDYQRMVEAKEAELTALRIHLWY